MASVVKSLLAALALVFVLAPAGATPLPLPINKQVKEQRFKCDGAIDLFTEGINQRARARVKYDPEVLAWANQIMKTKCVGNKVAQITFRSYAVILTPHPKDPKQKVSMCVVAEMTVIAGLNPDGSVSVENMTEMEILGMQECKLAEVLDAPDGGTRSSGGDQ
jgi:hypothetical protein